MNEPHFLCLAVVISARDYTQTKDNHVTNVMVSGIKMTGNWFVDVIQANITDMVANSVTKASSSFSNIEKVTYSTLNTINDIGCDTVKMINDAVRRFRASDGRA